jgi:hypothetical protein
MTGKCDTNAEYKEKFQGVTAKPSRGVAMKQELEVGGDFYGSTENREQYLPHKVEPRQKTKIAQYVANPNKMDSETTHQSNYRAWAIPPRFIRDKPKYVPGPLFDGTTTTKSSYVPVKIPERFKRILPEIEKTGDLMVLESTQKSDYKQWPITHVPNRHENKFAVRVERPF